MSDVEEMIRLIDEATESIKRLSAPTVINPKELTDKEIIDWLRNKSTFCPIYGNAHDGSYLCPRGLDDAFARVAEELRLKEESDGLRS